MKVMFCEVTLYNKIELKPRSLLSTEEALTAVPEKQAGTDAKQRPLTV